VPYKDPEKERQYQKRYRGEHGATRREYERKYRLEKPEKRRATERKSYNKNRERKLAQNHRWHKDNLEYHQELMQKWNADHPEERKIYRHNRRARIKGNGGILPPNALQILFTQQSGLCYLCSEPFPKLNDPASIEHKIPISRGGSNNISNIGLAHLSCNLRKHTKTHIEFLKQIEEDDYMKITKEISETWST
jgi:5-methylcytosine-specific restriction endonuclease McrA